MTNRRHYRGQATVFRGLDIAGLLLLFGLGSSSMYVFPSGYPQICDAFLLAFTFAVFFQVLTGRIMLARNNFLGTWFLLVLWLTAVNLVWVLIYQQSSKEIAHLMLLPPFYYWHNFLLGSALFLYLTQKPLAGGVVEVGLSIALLISASGVLLGMEEAGRATGFFNNPNQLAHFALCSLAVILVSYRGKIPLFPLPLAAVASGLISILGPASLGAISGLILLLGGWMVANIQYLRRAIQAAAAAMVLAAAVLVFDSYAGGGLERSLVNRFSVSERKLLELLEGGRGYDRFLSYPEYLVLGAGEGAWHLRFQPYHHGVEIHSSLGTILFCYGAVGLALFLFLLWIVVRSCPIYVSCLVAGLIVYSLTHMGLRTDTFWIFLVVAYATYSPKVEPHRGDVAAFFCKS